MTGAIIGLLAAGAVAMAARFLQAVAAGRSPEMWLRARRVRREAAVRPVTPAGILVQRVAVRVGAAALAALFYGIAAGILGHGILPVAAAVVGFSIPSWLAEVARARRLEKLGDQLDMAMGQIAARLRQGVPLEVALREVAQGLGTPLGPVLMDLVLRVDTGIELGRAVQAVRVLPEVADSLEFQVFATQVAIAHERGANVIRTFEALRDVLAERRRHKKRVAEEMARHLYESLAIMATGLIVLALYALTAPDGLKPLMRHAIGRLVLAASIGGNILLYRYNHIMTLRQIQKV